MRPIFVGRESEQTAFSNWMTSEPLDERRVALLVGHPGSGKSALLERFEQIALDHGPHSWFVQRFELNSSESPSQFLERILGETHRLLRGRFLRTGPADQRLLQGLLKAIPKVGNLLSELVSKDHRPGWLRFVEYCEAVSHSLKGRDERLVLLIDPHREMSREQPEDWLSVAKKLPPCLRIVIAQRPADPIVAHSESRLVFTRIAGDGLLGDLGEAAVRMWYKEEIGAGRLLDPARSWSDEVRRKITAVAYAKFGGFAYAQDSVIRVLASEWPSAPLVRVSKIPADLESLLQSQFESLVSLGKDRLRAALVLQTFSVPTPKEVWARAAQLELEEMTAALSDARYRAFFTEQRDGRYAPFHALFGQRLEEELKRNPGRAQELAEVAWGALEPVLVRATPDRLMVGEFEVLAATRIAARLPGVERLKKAMGLVADAKLRLNLVDDYEADLRLVLQRCGSDAITSGDYLGALGALYMRRGDLARAEEFYLQSLAIGSADVALPDCSFSVDLWEQIQRLRQIAEAACHGLSSLYRESGRLAEADAMSMRALGFAGGKRTIASVVRQHGEKGRQLAAQKDFEGAEGEFRTARALSRQFGSAGDFETSCANLGVLYTMKGQLEDASRVLHEGLDSARARGSRETMAQCLYNLGVVEQRRGNHEDARKHWEEARTINEQLDRVDEVKRLNSCLDGLPPRPAKR